MDNLTREELKRVTRVCERIHCIVPNEPFSNHLSVVLSNLLPCVHLTIDRVSLETCELQEMVSETLPPDLLQLAQPFMHEHPGVKQAANPDGPQHGTILTEVKRDEFRRTGLYNESMRPLDIEDQLWMSFRQRGNLTGVVYCRDTPFSEKEQLIAAMVQPHINISWRNWLRMRDMEERINLLFSAENHKDQPSQARSALESPLDGMTKRQRQVVESVAVGMTNREIADLLGISARTVGKHLEQIYMLLDVHTRTALAQVWSKSHL